MSSVFIQNLKAKNLHHIACDEMHVMHIVLSGNTYDYITRIKTLTPKGYRRSMLELNGVRVDGLDAVGLEVDELRITESVIKADFSGATIGRMFVSDSDLRQVTWGGCTIKQLSVFNCQESDDLFLTKQLQIQNAQEIEF